MKKPTALYMQKTTMERLKNVSKSLNTTDTAILNIAATIGYNEIGMEIKNNIKILHDFYRKREKSKIQQVFSIDSKIIDIINHLNMLSIVPKTCCMEYLVIAGLNIIEMQIIKDWRD